MSRLFLVTSTGTLALHALIAALGPDIGSFRKYSVAAQKYLANDLASERLADFSPLYFHLNVAAERFLPNPEAALVALQILGTALAAGWLALLLQRRCGLPITVAAVTAFALDRHVLVYQRVLEPEAFLVAAVLGWLCLIDTVIDQRAADGAPKAPWLAGILAGLALLLRPTLLPIYLLVPLCLWLRGDQRWRRHTLLFLAPVVVAVALLSVRQAVLTGNARTPVMNPGTVFYEGTNPLSEGTSAIYPPLVLELSTAERDRPDAAHQIYRRVARAATGQELTPSEVNRYWSGLAMQTIRAEPGRYLGLLRDKLQRVFHGYRWHDVPQAWLYDHQLRLPSLPFAVIAILALLGLILETQRWRESLLLYLVGATQLAVMLVFYVSARQRLLLLPLLLYFGAAALQVLVDSRPRWRWFPGGPLVALAAALALILSLPNDLTRDDAYQNLGKTAGRQAFAELMKKQSEPMAANRQEALEAVAHTPWVAWTPAYFPQEDAGLAEQLATYLAAFLDGAQHRGTTSLEFDLAALELEAGKLDEAERRLRRLLETDSRVYRGSRQTSQPRVLLARVLARRAGNSGNTETGEAVALLREALERVPADSFAAADLVVLDPANAERWRSVLEKSLSRLDTSFLLGRAYFFHGRYPEAARELEIVVQALPEARTARLYLAAALNRAERLDDAVDHFLKARRQAPDPLLLSHEIADLAGRWAEAHPNDPEVRLLAARTLYENGFPKRALTLLEASTPPQRWRQAYAGDIRELRLVDRILNPENEER